MEHRWHIFLESADNSFPALKYSTSPEPSIFENYQLGFMLGDPLVNDNANTSHYQWSAESGELGES